MVPKVGLEVVVNALPDHIVTAEDQAYLETVIPEELKGSFRLPKEIRRFKDNYAAEILGVEVAKKALDRAGLQASDIDYIIASNVGGRLLIPMVGTHIHYKLGFPEEVPVLNMQNACASFVDACEVAWNLVIAGKYKRILVVTLTVWETSGAHGRADLTDPFNGVFGDGAGAAIVSSQNLKCEFLSYYNRTLGYVYDDCALDLRGPANPGLKGAPEQPSASCYVYSTPRFFEWWTDFGKRFGVDSLTGALNKAGLKLSDLDLVIHHQPADMLFDPWIDGAEEAGLSRDKWKNSWDRLGNMGNCVVPVNLADMWDAGELKKDMMIAFITIGAGAHAPTMIVRWLEEGSKGKA